MNVNDIKFRCSSLGCIMTEPRSGKGLSETTKNYLADVFVSAKYGRKTEVSNKAIEKGLQVEEDSLTLFSRYKGEFFIKNCERLENGFIQGCPDIMPKNDGIVIDIKSSWDIFTFFRTKIDKLNKMYYWQIQGYCDLTKAESGRLAYCLTNTPEAIINDEKRRLSYKITNSIEYEQACDDLDRLMIYDDILINERVIEIDIPRNDEDIDRIHSKVIQCREYIYNTFIK